MTDQTSSQFEESVFQLGTPKYERVKRRLLAELTSGRLKPGETLPSEQTLAAAHGIARNTVRQALSELERQGWIRRVQGKGTFVEQRQPNGSRLGVQALALVVPETRTAFYPSLLHGFEAACRELRCQAVVSNTQNDVDKQASTILHLLDQGVGGVAVVPTSDNATPAYQIRHLQRCGVPTVFCHRPVEGIQAPLIALPFVEVGRLAAKAFLAHGHRRVAMLVTHRTNATERYVRGLRAGMRAGGGELPEKFVFCGTSIAPDLVSCEGEFEDALRMMFSDDDPPTAVMTSFDSLAELVYLLAGRIGIRIPDDLSLMGFGGTWRDGAVSRRLTSVVVDAEQIGRRACGILQEMAAGTRDLRNGERLLMELSVCEGQTLKAIGPPIGPDGFLAEQPRPRIDTSDRYRLRDALLNETVRPRTNGDAS